jgi:hypothetical protein
LAERGGALGSVELAINPNNPLELALFDPLPLPPGTMDSITSKMTVRRKKENMKKMEISK